jgi:hypothetical protein
MKSSIESYVTLRNTLRSLCYVNCFTCLAIASKYYVIHCLTIAAQYNVFWLFGTTTVMTKEATLPVFRVQIKYLPK